MREAGQCFTLYPGECAYVSSCIYHYIALFASALSR